MLALPEKIVPHIWTWLGTDFGTSTFFFVLDFLVVVVVLPEVLNLRERRRWSSLAYTLMSEALTTIEGVSGKTNALYGFLYPALDEYRQTRKNEAPDPSTLEGVRKYSSEIRRAIEDFKSLFSLAGISIQSYPKYNRVLGEFVRSLLECEKSLCAMEASPDWYWLWARWLILRDEVSKKQQVQRGEIQSALKSLART